MSVCSKEECMHRVGQDTRPAEGGNTLIVSSSNAQLYAVTDCTGQLPTLTIS